MVRLMVGGQRVAGLNGVRDQFRCSALHYAYADGDSQQIQQLLLEAGCSEVAFDMVRILQLRASRRRSEPPIGTGCDPDAAHCCAPRRLPMGSASPSCADIFT